MFRFLLDFCPSGHSHTSFNSVEIHPRPLTFLNNQNRCPTSAGTGTLLHQPSMFHPLNPLKTVPTLGHFLHENTRIFPSTNQNILNFMSVCLPVSHFTQRALRHWPSSLSTSVEIYTPVRDVRPEPIRVIALTNINNKNGWNTSMCSSSTLLINLSTSPTYPPKKWNTPVTLFPRKQSTLPSPNPNF